MTNEFSTVARQMQGRWAEAFARKDWSGLAALYTERPAFYGSTPDLHTDQSAVLAYFKALPASLSEARYATPDLLSLGPECFAASGDVVFINCGPSGELPLAFRMTQVFVRDGSDWRIAVHHASARPGPLLGP